MADYLAANQLGSQAVVTPEIARLDWAGCGIAVDARGAVDADRVGITGCFCAVAETGTLLLLSGTDTPADRDTLADLDAVMAAGAALVLRRA